MVPGPSEVEFYQVGHSLASGLRAVAILERIRPTFTTNTLHLSPTVHIPRDHLMRGIWLLSEATVSHARAAEWYQHCVSLSMATKGICLGSHLVRGAQGLELPGCTKHCNAGAGAGAMHVLRRPESTCDEITEGQVRSLAP